MMIKTTNSLNTEWCYYYGQFGPTGPINTGIGFRADETNDGGYIMAGMWKESGGYKMQLIKTDSLGQSSCNQGSPALGCTESTPIQSSTFLSIFPISSGTGFANATIEQIALASDSVLCLTTSLTEHNENSESIKIYPNPASNYISVVNSNHANSESEVFIFDINGKLILHSFLSPGENEINIENLRSGVYSVRTITDGYSISVNRLVKL
ncbi:MAG: T9SS type A sorting domain-containing protein [Bacteroidetes bacterium]|nr:T9SS type A sorting domain-containing protein [Bacteroidota bacterium]